MSSLHDVARRWRESRDPQRRAHAAVFDALSDTIRDKLREANQTSAHDAMSPPFYFAALLSAVQEEHERSLSHRSDKSDESHALLVGVLVWLNETLPRLAAGIVFSKYNHVGQLLVHFLDLDRGTASLRPFALTCAVSLICHAPLCSQLRGLEAWRSVRLAAVSLFRSMLLLAFTPNDIATRTAAIGSIRSVLKSPPPVFSALLSRTTRLACERAILSTSGGDENGEADDRVGVAPETVVDALSINDGAMVNANRMLVLLGADLPAGHPSLFAMMSHEDASFVLSLVLPCAQLEPLLRATCATLERAATALSVDDCMVALSALCSLFNVNDNLMPNYADALGALSAAVGVAATGYMLNAVVGRLLPMLRHRDGAIRRSSAMALSRVLSECLGHMANVADTDQVVEMIGPTCEAVRGCLRTPFRESWSMVLDVLTALASVLGAACEPLLGDTLRLVAEMYATGESSAELMASMRAFVAAMLRSIGPSILLTLLPLEMHADSSLIDGAAREWLLPILRDSIPLSRSVSLDLFSNMLLPLADELSDRATDLAANGAPTEAVLARLLQQRCASLWALLPAICAASPINSDFATSFPGIAQRLAATIESDATHRAVAAQSLSTLIETNHSVVRAAQQRESLAADAPVSGSSESVGDRNVECARANITAIAAVAARLLPRLVNALANFYNPRMGKQPNALTSMEALVHGIGQVGRITPPDLARAFCDRVLDRLANASVAAAALAGGGDRLTLSDEQQTLSDGERRSQRLFLTAVCGALAPALQREQRLRLLQLLTPPLSQSSDRGLQKSSFRALEALCRDGDSSFLDDNWSAVLAPLLVESMAGAVPSAKRLRLSCLGCALERRVSVLRSMAHALSHQQQPGKKTRRRVSAAAAAVSTLALELLPSAILCTSEANKRTRMAAMGLIDALADAMRRAGDDGGNDEDAATVRATSFVEQVAAGLAGASPLMIAATTRVLARVMRFYGSLLSDDVVSRLCDIVFMLLSSDDKQLARSAAIFARAVLSIRRHVVGERLEVLVPLLSRWASDPHHRFRDILRALFERLIGRFGFDAISPHVEHAITRRVITALRQRATRKKRRQTSRTADEDGSEDDHDIDNGDDERVDDRGGQATLARKRRGVVSDALLKDNAEPLDFLDSNSIRHVVSLRSRQQNAGRDDDDDDEETPLRLTTDGRLLVDDDDGEEEDDVNNSDSSDDDDGSNSMSVDGDTGRRVQWRTPADKSKKQKNKRGAGVEFGTLKRGAVDAGDEDDDKIIGSVQRGTSGRGGSDERDKATTAARATEESIRARRRRRRIEARRRAVQVQLAERVGGARSRRAQPVAKPGAEFKARRGGAGGDVQRAGELQPYAFVPLNPAALSQRRRKSATAELVAATKRDKKQRKR